MSNSKNGAKKSLEKGRGWCAEFLLSLFTNQPTFPMWWIKIINYFQSYFVVFICF